MKIELKDRTEYHVEVYFEKTKDTDILRMLPSKMETLEQAMKAYFVSKSAESTSFGKTIYAEGFYVGDIWCYSIHEETEPNAMLSYCVFEKAYWNCGIATQALNLFITEITQRFGLKSVGAFTFADNIASVHVLENNGFVELESFVEDGRESKYFQLSL